MATKQFFLQLCDGKTYGPVAEKSLRRLAARGKLTANDRIARSIDGPWYAVPPIYDGIAFDVEREGHGHCTAPSPTNR